MTRKRRNPYVVISHAKKAGRHDDKRKDTVMEIGIYEVTLTYKLRVPAEDENEAIESALDMIEDADPVPHCTAELVDKA